MTDADRQARTRQMRDHIARYGLTVTLVGPGVLPRYAYTVGLREPIGFDLMLLGGAFFDAEQVGQILNTFAANLLEDKSCTILQIPSLGEFTLREADPSWTRRVALAAADYYSSDNLNFRQVVPGRKQLTIDVPDASYEWSPNREPIWQWFDLPWSYNVPKSSVVMTNLDALRGAAITEISRYEEDYWEMFAGAGTAFPPEDARPIPLATLIAFDKSLLVALDIAVEGRGRWRESAGSAWNVWESSNEETS